MTLDEAISYIAEHGVVLASARGPTPSLAEIIAGEPINGSWWSHPRSRTIFAVLSQLEHTPEILTCRLFEGKITFVHRRLWPSLVRACNRFPREDIAQLHQEHTTGGHHVNRTVRFPDWVPADVAEQAAVLEEKEAVEALGGWVLAGQQ